MTSPAESLTSRRIEPFVASVWPWVDQMAERNPEAVFFGGGVPPTDMIPIERLRAGAERAWADGAEILLYGEVRGYRPLRDLIVARMAARGATVDPADVLITNGAQQGIDLVARVFVDPGDLVLTEAPTFMDALRVFRSHEAEPIGVPVDEEGLQVDALGCDPRTAAETTEISLHRADLSEPDGRHHVSWSSPGADRLDARTKNPDRRGRSLW